MHRWWMDFGGSFEAVFRRIRRFILVVWAKNAPERGPNDTQKAPPISALHLPRASGSILLTGGHWKNETKRCCDAGRRNRKCCST